MLASLIKGGVMGGVVMFLWGMISWTVLPWHDATMKRFVDESAVAAVLTANAPRRGVYILPYPGGTGSGSASTAAAQTGPRAFVAYDDRASFSMSRPMGGALLINILGALCLTWLLVRARLGYWGRVLSATAAGVFAGVVADLPAWNWWGFSTPFTIIAFLDHMLGGFLAGLVIAWVIDDAPLGRPRA